MDVMGNAFNTNNPAGLPVAQDHVLPLIQDSRKGPAVDLDAFLLLMLEEHLQGMSVYLSYDNQMFDNFWVADGCKVKVQSRLPSAGLCLDRQCHAVYSSCSMYKGNIN